MLTALLHRRATGEGQHIEMAQVEAAMQLIGPELLAAAETGVDAPPDGNHVPHASPHNAFPARGEDEWVVIAAGDDAAWCALCDVAGWPDLRTDPRFTDLAARRANEAELDAMIGAWTAGEDKHDLAARLQAAGVAAAPVNTPRDLAASPYLEARGFFTPLTHPHAGTHRHPGLPFHLEVTPGAYRKAAPAFGADNRAILRDVLHRSDEAIAAMERSGAIASAPNPGA